MSKFADKKTICGDENNLTKNKSQNDIHHNDTGTVSSTKMDLDYKEKDQGSSNLGGYSDNGSSSCDHTRQTYSNRQNNNFTDKSMDNSRNDAIISSMTTKHCQTSRLIWQNSSNNLTITHVDQTVCSSDEYGNTMEPNCLVEITDQTIDLMDAYTFTSTPLAGAQSSFLGVTRNNFDGKLVTRLEYECYTPMAMKELQNLCNQTFSKFNDILKIALIHRIGNVPVQDASVLIVVSSSHRRDGLDAVSFLIDTLKARVPIWKKEWYGEQVQTTENINSSLVSSDRQHLTETGYRWKSNAECGCGHSRH